MSHTGASTSSTNFFNSSLAPERTAPPPTNMYGFLDFSISPIALPITSSVRNSVLGDGKTISAFLYSVFWAVTSFGISTRTGPGRPFLAISKALLIVAARLFISLTIKLYFVIGVVIPAISTS